MREIAASHAVDRASVRGSLAVVLVLDARLHRLVKAFNSIILTASPHDISPPPLAREELPPVER
jgi:hypothetical protein